MVYVPGDNWVICDISGKKVLMSQTRKTWDGFRVHRDFWYPRNPQDFLRSIPDRMAVIDGRPRPADLTQVPAYGPTDFCLISPNFTNYIVHVADDGAMLVTAGTWGQPLKKFHIDKYAFTVDNDGALHVNDDVVKQNVVPWRLRSPSGIIFEITVDPDLAVIMTQAVAFPPYMEGVFTLISPNGTYYVIYIEDNKAVRVRLGDWGPRSTYFFLDTWRMRVTDVGALQVRASGERWPEQHRMVSTGGFEYMWTVDSRGAVRIGREGHFWDVPVLVEGKPVAVPLLADEVTFDATGAVTESGREVWTEE